MLLQRAEYAAERHLHAVRWFDFLEDDQPELLKCLIELRADLLVLQDRFGEARYTAPEWQLFAQRFNLDRHSHIPSLATERYYHYVTY